MKKAVWIISGLAVLGGAGYLAYRYTRPGAVVTRSTNSNWEKIKKAFEWD